MTYMSTVLTIRLSKEEEALLTKRAKHAGLKKSTFVRQLINEPEIRTGTDALAWGERHKGDKRLRITPRA